MTIDDVGCTMALRALLYSQANISGHKVGAAILASDGRGTTSFFRGSNIELATSKCWHAEEVALVKAIAEGFRDIRAVYVSSTNTDQRAACCGYCMQSLMYANPDAEIVVVNMDGSIKLRTTVKERNGPYAYWGKGRLDP